MSLIIHYHQCLFKYSSILYLIHPLYPLLHSLYPLFHLYIFSISFFIILQIIMYNTLISKIMLSHELLQHYPMSDRAETMHACVLQFFIEQNGARREEHRGSGEFTFTGTNRKISLPCHITESIFFDNSRRNSSSPSKSMKIGVVVCPII